MVELKTGLRTVQLGAVEDGIGFDSIQTILVDGRQGFDPRTPVIEDWMVDRDWRDINDSVLLTPMVGKGMVQLRIGDNSVEWPGDLQWLTVINDANQGLTGFWASD